MAMKEAFEMLLDCLRIQADNLAHGEVELICGAAVKLVEHFQTHPG